MELIKLVYGVEAGEIFKKWKEAHENSFLASVFGMTGNEDLTLNYYDKDKDKMYSFSCKSPCEPNEQDFVKSGEEILPVRVETIKVPIAEALKKSYGVAEKNYSEQRLVRTIFALQVLGGKQVWNITFITADYKTINIRIDCISGDVIGHTVAKLSEFMEK
ncbi:MAG: hypothetical protein V1702_03790 [Candidatus Woesearchaeota archaeon]